MNKENCALKLVDEIILSQIYSYHTLIAKERYVLCLYEQLLQQDSLWTSRPLNLEALGAFQT